MRRLSCLALLAAAACGGAEKKETVKPVDPPVDHKLGDGPPDDGDEPDDIQVEGLRGTLDVSEIQPVVEKRWGEIEGCYAAGIGRNRFVGGKLELKFRVNRDGTVKRVQVAEGDLGAWQVEKCVLDVARAMTFARPKGGEAEFGFPIEFPGRGAVGILDDAAAETQLAPDLAELDECAEAAGGRPEQVRITVYVGAGGRVLAAGFATPAEEPFADEWADCAAEKALAWRLADPRGKVKKAQGWYPPP